MKNSLYILFTVILYITHWACKKDVTTNIQDENNLVSFQTPIDKWIYDSFTLPYNVEVKYRFDASDNGGANLLSPLIPPREDKIIPLLRAIKRVWIDTYEKLAGRDFIRTYIPKQILLVGSNLYNPDGTVTSGVAEGGKRILLFNVNAFDLIENFANFTQIIHIMEHEFGHILHQTVLYPAAFRTISSPADYTAQWYNVRAPENYGKGFITSYSMANSDEDFVEVLSNVLSLGLDSTKKLFDTATIPNNKHGLSLFEEKVGTVRVYLHDIWNIDFQRLEDSTLSAIKYVEKNAQTYNTSTPIYSNSN